MYGKIVFNNIKEYTPYWIKTVPYSKCAKPILKKGAQKVSPLNADPKMKRFWRGFQMITHSPTLWQTYIFFNVFFITATIYYPWRYVYSANNRMRSINYAINKEKLYKQSQQNQEE